MTCLDRSDKITCKQMNNENVSVGQCQNIDVLYIDTYPPPAADMGPIKIHKGSFTSPVIEGGGGGEGYNLKFLIKIYQNILPNS